MKESKEAADANLKVAVFCDEWKCKHVCNTLVSVIARYIGASKDTRPR